MKAYEILGKSGLELTAWGIRIIHAQNVGGFSSDDRCDSLGWTTCACGELDESLMEEKGDGVYAPADPQLFRLGCDFYDEVRTDDYCSSARTLVAIEARVMELSL